jgi:GrpB-like predicted nucleotidyltransferase (UPF0157 family)
MIGQMHGTPLGGDLDLVDYNPAWPQRFVLLREQLAAELGSAALRIDHIGSTAVPGLAAKDVIDIQVIVADEADEGSYRAAVESTGVELRYRETQSSWSFFRPMQPPRTRHVHVTSAGSARERAQLLFVDYLRSNAPHRDAYAALKRRLAVEFADDRIGYTDAKTTFVTDTLHLAEQWAAACGWAVPRAIV